jgi:hypothetical protein
MISEHYIDSKKVLIPIKNSKWFYIFLLLGVAINWFLIGLIGVWIVLGLFGIFVLLHFSVHLQHLIHDRKIRLIVDYGNKKIGYYRGNRSVEIPFEEIEVIQRFMGSKYPRTLESYVIPSNFYHWTRIITKNGLMYSFSNFVKDDLNIFGIKRIEIIIPFLNLIK